MYTILPPLVVAWAATTALGQVELRMWPPMTKGPEGAPVTIVEFSDYQ